MIKKHNKYRLESPMLKSMKMKEYKRAFMLNNISKFCMTPNEEKKRLVESELVNYMVQLNFVI